MIAEFTPKRTPIALLALVALVPVLSGCGLFGGTAAEPGTGVLLDAESEEVFQQEAPIEEPAAEFEESAVEEGYAATAPSAPAVAGEAVDGDTGDFGGGESAEPLAGAPAEFEARSEVAEGDSFGADEVAPESAPAAGGAEVEFAPQQVLALQAGEIDDNADWDDYLFYRRQFLDDGYYNVHDVDVTGRHVIDVRYDDGLPVLGARVRVYSGQRLVSDTRTYATGQTLFHPNATRRGQGENRFRVVVEKDGDEAEFTLNVNETNEWFVTLQGKGQSLQDPIRLDVMFLIDATGSMADEIEELESNILSISAQIDDFPGQVQTRYGMVAYRDRGDEYVTRVYDFTPDVRDFQADLSSVRAEGGGDNPESLNEGLHDALHRPEWRVEDTVSLMILVADAPPHLDYANDYDYAEEMVEAARLGVKIHPIASSGLDPQGEFIFRQIGQYTMGHFIFLAYEEGQQGEFVRDDLEAGGQDFSVEALDELVVRLIGDELYALFNE
jgi:hypothetical protein